MKYKINGISTDPFQEFTVSVPETGKQVKISLRYLPTQRAWYMDFLYENIEENCIKLVISPNILRSYKKMIPFGLAITSINDMYPMDIDSFYSGQNSLYLLDSTYVNNLENSIYDR